jgi:membrane protease YdiL (CAAX protease family)
VSTSRRPSRFYRVAWAFYLVLALGGLVGLAAQGERIEWRLLVDPASWWLDLAAGMASGSALLAGWLVARRFLAPARELEQVMARLLGRTTRHEVVALATISALAEEVAFRGALQHAIGWLGAAALFALLHIGPRAPFLLWSLFALAGGLAFGWIMELRQALLGPIVGHLIVNLVQLRRLADARGDDTVGLLPDD